MAENKKIRFSVGYNFDPGFFEAVRSYKDHIEAVYFPVPERYAGSGRCITQPAAYASQLPGIIRKCRSLNVIPQVLLNAICDSGAGLKKDYVRGLTGFLRKLKGSEELSVVLANPLYAGFLKDEVKGIRLESSVNCFVKTVEHARYMKELGIDVVTVDRDINRNIALIKAIKEKSGTRIRVMLNEGCLRNCPFRVVHYNYLSHKTSNDRPVPGVFFDCFCVQIYQSMPEKIFSVPFIPPEALGYYEHTADYFKLSTRVFSTGQITECLRAYVNRRLDGNLLRILDCPGMAYFEYIDYGRLKSSGFFPKMLKCSSGCRECGYCGKVLREAVVLNGDFPAVGSFQPDADKIRIYSKLLESVPDKWLLRLNMGRAYFRLGEYDKAAESALLGIRESPSLDRACGTHLFLGHCYEKRGEYGKAIKEFKKEEALNRGNPGIHVSLMRCYKKSGRSPRLIDKELLFLNRRLSKNARFRFSPWQEYHPEK